MKSVLAWLDEVGTVTKYEGTEQFQCQVRIVERLAELIIVNKGSMSVSSWGNIEQGVGPYGRFGLTLPEALELINLGGILHGFVSCMDDEVTHKDAMAKIRHEAEKVVREGFDPYKGLVDNSKTARDRKPIIGIYSEEEMLKEVASKKAVEPHIRVRRSRG